MARGPRRLCDDPQRFVTTQAIGAEDHDADGADDDDNSGHVRVFDLTNCGDLRETPEPTAKPTFQPTPNPTELQPTAKPTAQPTDCTTLIQELDGDSAGDRFGYALDMSSTGVLVVGAPYDNSEAGSVHVYNNVYSQLGNVIDGPAGGRAGWTVSSSSDGLKVALGAPYYDSGKGLVRTYELVAGTWTLYGGDITKNNAQDDDHLGYSICVEIKSASCRRRG